MIESFTSESSADMKLVLTKLSDEIITMILENAIIDEELASEKGRCVPIYNYSSIKTVALVCRQFNNIVCEFLFRALQFESSNSFVPPSESLQRFSRQLAHNPSLGRYCWRLSVDIADYLPIEENEFEIATNITLYLPNAALQNMQRIEHLFISRSSWGLYLSQILEACGDIPSVTLLDLFGTSQPEEEAFQLESKKYRTALFTTLRISNFEDTPNALNQLLLWPKSILHFNFKSLYGNKSHWELRHFDTALEPHRASLQTLEIGHLTRDPARQLTDQIFVISGFPSLDTLVLHELQLEKTDQQAAASMLLTPKLRTFGYSFNINDQVHEYWEEFDAAQEEWLRKFAFEAMARR
ncbi:hypothetical protein K505DRAFT_331624 [Melanomma pulvis-pyrius CBS 109.77]|uniref:F-box domain-containing protein n=1 Tax=Melanomma pulvis-pyrius CBS 109.77 TaxID=1314802 RepID=A0A6A6XVI9_9PLEO|nr:hypothetical protein K505DRAFT_331624 [Melanomma pulvis-pyrius CBS 109.77]